MLLLHMAADSSRPLDEQIVDGIITKIESLQLHSLSRLLIPRGTP